MCPTEDIAWTEVDPTEGVAPEWRTVVNGKLTASAPAVVRYVRAEESRDREADRCTDGHPECMQSAEQLCVYKVRKRYLCSMQTRAKGGCEFGSACYFEHPPKAEKCSSTYQKNERTLPGRA